MRIGIVATGTRIETSVADRVLALAKDAPAIGAPALFFHPQCFEQSGHFAGDDEARARAFLEIANDAAFDAIWFARGGHGACRLAELILPNLNRNAREKRYLGYSDAGFLLAGLYKAGAIRVAHGPMAIDIIREGGDAAVLRALSFLGGDEAGLEPHLSRGDKAAAFNITVLSHLLGTQLEPDLTGHVLMLEDVNEYMYRIDRALFHITSQPAIRRVKGIRLGRCDPVPPNEPDFVQTEEEVARHWCAASGIAYLGRADIGHDPDNKIVPFGNWPAA
jgi:muramoyltetrapeptide carboxypeptidase